MLIHNCLRSLENLNAKVRRRRASRAAPKPSSVQPFLEPLENRIVLNSTTATVAVAAGTLTITDTIAAKVSVNESFNAHTGTNYKVTVTDATGTTSTTVTGVTNIAVALTGNAPGVDTVALTRTSGPALAGNLTITDTDPALDKLSVSIGTGFNVNGAVTVSAPGAGSAVGVTSSNDSFGSVTVLGGALRNASAGSSLVSLTNDQIAGNVAAILTAGSGNGDAVNLVNDTIGGTATIAETGVVSSTGESATVNNTSITGDLGVVQTSSKSQSLTVNNGSSVGGNLAVTQVGALNATVSLADLSVGGSLAEIQAGKSTSTTSLSNTTVGTTLTATQLGSTASFTLSGSTVASSATIVQGFGNNATTTVTNGTSVGALTIAQGDAISNTANVGGGTHDGGALSISQGGVLSNAANQIALSGQLVVVGATTLTQASDNTNAIGVDDSTLIGATTISQAPGFFESQSNSVEFGSAAGDTGMTFFGPGGVTVTQGVAGTNTDTIAASEFVDFAGASTFTLDPTSTNSITDTLANTLGFNNLTSNVPITVI